MTKVTSEGDAHNVVSGSYSTGTGPVLRSEKMEVTKISFEKGKGADIHTHPEEQVMYVLSGGWRSRATARPARWGRVRRRSIRPTRRTV